MEKLQYPLLLTVFFTLHSTFTWLVSISPYLLLILGFVALIAMSLASNYQHCESCQSAPEFGSASATTENQKTKTVDL